MIEYRLLGSTGVRVSSLSLGTMMLGSWGNSDEDSSVRIIHQALDAGINLVDTADIYAAGGSEEIVGRALAGARRGTTIVATKFHGSMGPSPNAGGNSRRWIHQAVEDSLRRLRTDWIDLYQVHRPDPHTDIAETLGALDDLVRSGKIRYVGTSTFPASELVEAQWAAAKHNLNRPVCEQPNYSVLIRGIEAEVLPVCQRHSIGVVTWSPLAAGWLSDRAQEDGTSSARHRLQPTRFDLSLPGNRRKRDAVESLRAVAHDAGLSLEELALGFVAAHPAVTSVIIGPRTSEQLHAYLAAAAARLDEDTLDKIDEVVPPGRDVNQADIDWTPPALTTPRLRRRPNEPRSDAPA